MKGVVLKMQRLFAGRRFLNRFLDGRWMLILVLLF